jgi:glycosyltransferase involved in cell wall biosynthesis
MKKFVIVIPSYNNELYCDKNMASVLKQNYSNYRIIYVDDCSSDKTVEKVDKIIDGSIKSKYITLIKNKERVGAMENLYNMIHSCEDDEIIITVDGDDWMVGTDVLSKLNGIYSNDDVWMTYGQHKRTDNMPYDLSAQYPKDIIASNSFRSHKWSASHLRTFYAWLFKKIKKEDLMYAGKFYSMTYDLAMMFPMLEMSGERSRFISEIFYVYNRDNVINDNKVSLKTQLNFDRIIRSKPKYQKIIEKV